METGVQCPKCQKWRHSETQVAERQNFLFLFSYPKCDYALWDPPLRKLARIVPSPMLTIKVTKRKGAEKVCPQKNCKYATPYEGDPEDAGK